MGFTLPGGFSPVKAIQQVGSVVNPTGGTADYDVFSQSGTQRDGQQYDVTTNGAYEGSRYYNPETGQVEGYSNGAWSPVSGDGGGGGGYVAPDPYARWGGQTAYNNLVSGFNNQEANVLSSGRGAIDAYGSKYNRSILDFLDSQRMGQGNLDTQATRTELAKMQGAQGVMGMVGQGIRSAGTMLSNKNASDSSAAGAIAQAYGKIGQGEMANIGNQYAMGMDDYNTAQANFDIQEASGIRNMLGSKEDSVNEIVGDVSDKLSAIDAQIMDADLPTRIALEQRKNEIKAHAKSALQALDKKLTDGAGAIDPMSRDARLSRAGEMGRAGTNLGADAFQYSTDAPTSWQGGSPSGSSFPLYTMPRGRRQG